MIEERALSRIGSGSLIIHGGMYDELPTIHRMFRDLTRPEWCRSRKVYYVEKGFGGRVRLRQVTSLPRKGREQDPVLFIGREPIDLDVIKAQIATANVDQALSGVRWELYGDTQLCELVAQGRFDIVDLIPRDRENVHRLVAGGHLNVDLRSGALDFDNILTTHECPKCHCHRFGLDILMFVPEWMRCDACGFSGSSERLPNLSPVFALVRRLDHTKDILPASISNDAPEAMHFVEVVATPALAQLICHWHITVGGGYEKKPYDHFEPENVRRLYERSLFNLLRIEVIRRRFIRCVSEHFNRRIAEFEAGHVPEFCRGEGRDDEIRAQRITEWTQDRQTFEEETEELAHLDELLFDATSIQNGILRLERIRGIISKFTLYLEDLIEVLWEDHCAPTADITERT
ncbi:MAG: hypothetical protein AAB403_15430 [Planctomycetota bacterium]